MEDVRAVLAELPNRSDREPVVGAGMGGDDTTAIDAAVERAVVSRFDPALWDEWAEGGQSPEGGQS